MCPPIPSKSTQSHCKKHHWCAPLEGLIYISLSREIANVNHTFHTSSISMTADLYDIIITSYPNLQTVQYTHFKYGEEV